LGVVNEWNGLLLINCYSGITLPEFDDDDDYDYDDILIGVLVNNLKQGVVKMHNKISNKNEHIIKEIKYITTAVIYFTLRPAQKP
jgi:hypothetical protein